MPTTLDESQFDETAPLSPAAEALVDVSSTVIDAASAAAKCVAASKNAAALSKAFEMFDEKYLGPIGSTLAAFKVANLVKKRETSDAVKETVLAATDTIVCRSGGPVCVSWMVGKTIGELLNNGPRWAGLSDKTVNDWWTDEIAHVLHPDPTDADYARLESDAHAKIVAAQAATGIGSKCPGVSNP